MDTVKCKNCGHVYLLSGITVEEYKELSRKNPELCDECGYEVV